MVRILQEKATRKWNSLMEEVLPLGETADGDGDIRRGFL
jgi:hypothetical protein